MLITAFAHDDRAPDTVNRDADDIGAGGGQSNGPDETLRIDFVQDLTRDAGEDEQDPGGYNFDTHVGQKVFSFTMIDTQSDNDTAVLIEAFNVDDEAASKEDVTDATNNDKVLIDPATIVVRVGNDILEQGVDYQIYPDGTGGYYLSPIPEGAVVTFQAVGGVTFEAVEITNAAGHPIPGDPEGDDFAGANFAIGGFSYGENDPGDPVAFELPVELTDADGDTSQGVIDVTVYPEGQVPTETTTIASTLMVEESSAQFKMENSSSLVASNDNADQAQARAFNVANQAALMGVLAAAGLNASAQLAVKDASSGLDHVSMVKVGHNALAAAQDSASVESDDNAAAVSGLAASGELEAADPVGRTSANEQAEASEPARHCRQ